MTTRYEHLLGEWLAHADVCLGGERPWDIRVHDVEFARRILSQGSLGVGESYMDGQWDCADLDGLVTRVLRAEIDHQLPTLRQLGVLLGAHLLNPQSPKRSFKVGRHHYDIGDDLYQRMLDARMIYTCAYWRHANGLEEAQEAKLDLVCRKLGLQPGMRVLDIGCGWGGAAQFAAQRYGVSVVGVTVSKNQAETARERCKGLPVEIRLCDYRSVEGRFDRIYSLGMFEHVGLRNYATYFQTARRLLVADGLFLLHTIGQNSSQRHNDPWIERYIFPNSLIPSIAQITKALEGCFVVEDWHNFGPDYDRTLMEWYTRFNTHWPELSDRYDERFKRMWTFWLLVAAAYFRARRNQVWQVVLSPTGIAGGYDAVR